MRKVKTNLIGRIASKRGLNQNVFLDIPDEQFKLIDGDIDRSTYVAVLLKDEVKRPYRYVGEQYNSFNCSCSHDCCGCLSSEYYRGIILDELIVIKKNEDFNY